MGSENVEVVRRLLEAFEHDDVDAQLAVMDPEVEIVERPEGPRLGSTRSTSTRCEAGR